MSIFGRWRTESGPIDGGLDRDGTLRESSGKAVGTFRDGEFRDDSGRLTHTVDGDGTIRNTSGQRCGKLESDGRMYDGDGRYLGRFEK